VNLTRHNAAVKAAATRKANRLRAQAHAAPPPPHVPRAPRPPFNPNNPWGVNKKKARVILFEALAKFEDALVAKIDERGRRLPEEDRAFDHYRKAMKRVLDADGRPNMRTEERNEVNNALRLAAIELIKAVLV
jgi:hypothetical protein